MSSGYGYIVLLVVAVAGLFAILTITDSLPSGDGFSNAFSGSNLFGLAGVSGGAGGATGPILSSTISTINDAKENPGPMDDLIVFEGSLSFQETIVLPLPTKNNPEGRHFTISFSGGNFPQFGSRASQRAIITVDEQEYELHINEGAHFADVWYIEMHNVASTLVNFSIRHFQAASTCSGLTAQTAFTGPHQVCCEGELTQLPSCSDGSDGMSTPNLIEPVFCGDWVFTCSEQGELLNAQRYEACAVQDCSEGQYPETIGYQTDGCPIQTCVGDPVIVDPTDPLCQNPVCSDDEYPIVEYFEDDCPVYECVPDFECPQDVICCDGQSVGRSKETNCGCPIGMTETPDACDFGGGYSYE